MDTPGWSVAIDLVGTKLERAPYDRISRNIGPRTEPTVEDWMDCRVERGKWKGTAGPSKLNELLEEFVAWAEKHDS